MSVLLRNVEICNHLPGTFGDPTFTVRESKYHSEVYTQTRGLRQGCPLSPYLFGFVLTHLFESAESQYVAEHGIISGVLRLGTSLWDLEYADDTVLLSGFTLAAGGKSPAKFMGVPKMQSRGSEAPEIRK